MSPYTPHRKPASGLVLCSGDDAVNVDRCCSDITPLSPLLAAGGPPVKNWPGLIIRRRRADSTRRRERPQDLASTSLWPSVVRSTYTPKPIGDIGISLIASSSWTQVSVVEGDSKSAAVFKGRYQPLPRPWLPLRPAPEAARSANVFLTGPVVVDPLLIVIF